MENESVQWGVDDGLTDGPVNYGTEADARWTYERFGEGLYRREIGPWVKVEGRTQ